LEQKLEFAVGDVCVSAGIVSYLGPFTQAYRVRQTREWVEATRTSGLLVREGYSLEACLAEPISVRAWAVSGLPADAFSRENAVITFTSARWPLFIDP
jgi:dynein heavy chain